MNSGPVSPPVFRTKFASTSAEDGGCIRGAMLGFILIVALPTLGFLCAGIGAMSDVLRERSAAAAVMAAALIAVSVGTTLLLRQLGRYFTDRALTIGSDGILVTSGGKPQFVPFKKIRSIEIYERGVIVALVHGWLRLPISSSSLDPPRSERGGALRAVRKDLHHRLEAAHALATRAGIDGRVSDLLDRRGRRIDVWKSALERLEPITDYRVGYQPEDLVSVAEDAAESPERRVAAAIAVRTAADDAKTSRVRVAADACIDLDLKRAIEQAIAEGEILEDEIERATKRRA